MIFAICSWMPFGPPRRVHDSGGAAGNRRPPSIIIHAHVAHAAVPTRNLFLGGRFLNLQCALSNNQLVDGLLTVLAMYRQFEPFRQKVLHHFGSAIRRLTCGKLRQDIPSLFVHPPRSRQLIPFDAVCVRDQVGERHVSVVGAGAVNAHAHMKLSPLDVFNR